MAEITETARNAEAQIAELASQSTEDDVGNWSSPQPGSDAARNHADADQSAVGIVSTPDGNIRPVATFVTMPYG